MAAAPPAKLATAMAAHHAVVWRLAARALDACPTSSDERAGYGVSELLRAPDVARPAGAPTDRREAALGTHERRCAP
eukprot:397353-Alexandrium_andersonii.AAC.1